jgi:hypothetical protein
MTAGSNQLLELGVLIRTRRRNALVRDLMLAATSISTDPDTRSIKMPATRTEMP